MYQYNMMQPRIRRRLGGCISGLVLLLLLAGGFGFVILRVHNGVTLSVGVHPTIVGDNCGGKVMIQAGPANQVTLSGIFPQFTQDSSTNTVEITQCDDGMTITVPSQADITLSATEEISVFGVSGTLKLDTDGSRIVMEGVTLEGNSKVSDNGGAIVMNGNMAAGSSPTIDDNGGSIDVTLPASASFHLNLTGIPGPIASNFPGIQAPGGNADALQINVGGNPSAVNLTLTLNDTAVVLQGV